MRDFDSNFGKLIAQLDEPGLARALAAALLLLMAQGRDVAAERPACLRALGRAKLGRHEAYQVIAGRKALEPGALRQLATRACRV